MTFEGTIQLAEWLPDFFRNSNGMLDFIGMQHYNFYVTFIFKLLGIPEVSHILTKEEMPACPVATTVQLIGSKWKLLILRNLRMRPWRFNELRRDLEGVSQKVLTDSLRAMEDDGIITRTVYPEVPPRVEYALSPLGKSMEPILDAMEQWGSAYQKMMNE